MNKNAISPIAFNRWLPLLGAALPLVLGGCGKSPEKPSAKSAPATPAPFTGQTHEVKMRGTAKGYFYEPAELSIKVGDKVRFVMVDGGPHNVSFANQKIPARATAIFEKEGKLVGVMLQAPGQTTDLIFGKNMPVGDYNFICDPHAALGMKGKISVSH